MRLFSWRKVIILITILALPSLLYYLLQEKGKNRYRPLPVFGPKILGSTFHTRRGKFVPDTIYHVVSSFKLVNQNADEVSFPANTKKLTVVNFFYTRCSMACSGIQQKLAKAVKLYERNDLLQFFSITVDPEFDTSTELKQFSQQYKSKKWNFLTGDKKVIYKLAKEDFFLDVLEDTIQKNNIIHSPMLVLLDHQKRIRGYYDGNNVEQIDHLIDEIKVLIAEELRNTKN